MNKRQCRECGNPLRYRERLYCSKQCRILSSIEVDRETGCWLWQGKINGSGYGSMWWRGEPDILAHRLSFETFKGPIPTGKFVCHTCDTPECVNPDHLWIGSHQDNMMDKVAKGRSRNGQGEDGKGRFSDEQIATIRQSNKTLRELGKIYGVSHAMIGYIKTGECYKEKSGGVLDK